MSVVERGDEVLGAVLHRQPDLILMDIQLPVMNGIQVQSRCCRARPEPDVRASPSGRHGAGHAG